MIKNSAYLFIFLLFCMMAFMWFTIDQKDVPEKSPQFNEERDQTEIVENIFKEELGT
ncbi:MAG: hypothetical protein ACI870_000020 [Crocinitomicaceae bacterium]|jgi:hypothetical protein